MKTPLAALSNELHPNYAGQALITRMDRLFGWHLRRARQAGPRLLGQRTPVAPVIDDILLVLRWPLADRGMTADVDCSTHATSSDERQELEEMIGNLSERAAKWGGSRLRITVRTHPTRLILRVEDDGPGLSPDHALMRGARLNELGAPAQAWGWPSSPIWPALQGGELRLDRPDLGGLAAFLNLPA